MKLINTELKNVSIYRRTEIYNRIILHWTQTSNSAKGRKTNRDTILQNYDISKTAGHHNTLKPHPFQEICTIWERWEYVRYRVDIGESEGSLFKAVLLSSKMDDVAVQSGSNVQKKQYLFANPVS